MGTVTSVIAGAAGRVSFADLDQQCVDLARHCLLDWIGVAIAGAAEPAPRLLLEELVGPGPTSGPSTILGRATSCTPRDAAFVNGCAGHVLDFDDVSRAMMGHPSAPVAPSVLALGEQLGACFGEVVEAFVAGVEAECRLGFAMGGGHYAAGWHATATIGTFGAAAGCARLLRLDEHAVRNTLGIAASSASGSQSVFGTMTKSLQVGAAASAGMLAAQLSARSFTSVTNALDDGQWFARVMTDSFDPLAAEQLPGGIHHVEHVLFKYHAAGMLTHATIEGILRLKALHGFDVSDVGSVVLTVPPGHLSVVNIDRPTRPLQGKFSLKFTAALALVRGEVSESAFTEATLTHPDVEAVRRLVEIDTDDKVTLHAGRTRVVLKDGAVFEMEVDLEEHAMTPDDVRRQRERLVAKFTGLVRPKLGAQADQLAELILEIDPARPLSEVMKLCVVRDG